MSYKFLSDEYILPIFGTLAGSVGMHEALDTNTMNWVLITAPTILTAVCSPINYWIKRTYKEDELNRYRFLEKHPKYFEKDDRLIKGKHIKKDRKKYFKRLSPVIPSLEEELSKPFPYLKKTADNVSSMVFGTSLGMTAYMAYDIISRML